MFFSYAINLTPFLYFDHIKNKIIIFLFFILFDSQLFFFIELNPSPLIKG